MTQEEKAKACDSNYKVYTELINRLECVKDAIKKQNYGIAMDILCKPYSEYQITASPELKEREDESIIRDIRVVLESSATRIFKENGQMPVWYDRAVAWLEKQGEHANFINKIQIGDKVTRNEDGVLVNLSQLKRVAKKDEKQDEQKSYASETMNEKWDFDSGFTRMMEKEQKHAAWSEEDEINLGKAIWYVENPAPMVAKNAMLVEWLKSLKDRYTWKPSKGQLECLSYAIEKAEKDWSPLTNNRIYLTLKALKEQLLELKGSKV